MPASTNPSARLLRLYAALGALLLLSCSEADFCQPGDPCVGFSYTGYRNVLTQVCSDACARLDECGETLTDAGDLDCEEACRSEATQDYYWVCEPRFRALLSCIAQRRDCELGACAAETASFNSCRLADLPKNANSCKLANNGVCDEPVGCVPGSDTTDCVTGRQNDWALDDTP